MRRPPLLLALLIALIAAPLVAAAQTRPMLIKVVVLTTFEVGADTGDRPGEFQDWVERYPLTHSLQVTGIERPVRYSDDGVLGVVTGMRARPRESLAALILDPRFDLSHAYWIVAGIAGVDPRAGSLGSAAWARFVVDADPIYEMDDRESPKDWPWGLYSLGTDGPGKKGSAEGSSEMVWTLNPALTQWAFQVSRGVALDDNAQLQAGRARFRSEPAALLPPKVFLGDSRARPGSGTESGAPAGRGTG